MQKTGMTDMLHGIYFTEKGTEMVGELFNMDGDQIRSMYNDVQSVVSGIYKVKAITTLGFRVVLTLNNFNPFACVVPSLDEIDASREPYPEPASDVGAESASGAADESAMEQWEK